METALLELWREPEEAAKTLYRLSRSLGEEIQERLGVLADWSRRSTEPKGVVYLPWTLNELPTRVRWMLGRLGFGGQVDLPETGPLRMPASLSLVLGLSAGMNFVCHVTNNCESPNTFVMQLTLDQAATRLGKSKRQVLYLIQTNRLPAEKVAGRWSIESDNLPLSEGQQRSHERKQRQLRAAVEEALDIEPEASRPKRYSVRDLKAFQIALPLHQKAVSELGAEHPATQCLKRVLEQLTQGCHRFERSDKADAYRLNVGCALRAAKMVQRLHPTGTGQFLASAADPLGNTKVQPRASGAATAYPSRDESPGYVTAPHRWGCA